MTPNPVLRSCPSEPIPQFSQVTPSGKTPLPINHGDDENVVAGGVIEIKLREVIMGKLRVFNFITLNGYFQGPKGDISWAHQSAEDEYAAEMLKGRDRLLFGRVTYDVMSSYWPTAQAMKDAPLVSQGMNSADKIVFSRTLDKAEWNNTRVVRDNISEEIRKLKEESARDLTILGSGSIVTQFAQEDLIDEFQIMVHPVVLAEGTSIFKGLEKQLNLELTSTRAFSSGKALLYYRPGKRT